MVKVTLVSIVILGMREGSVSQGRAAAGQGSGSYKSRSYSPERGGAMEQGTELRCPQIVAYRSEVSEMLKSTNFFKPNIYV